MAFLSRRELVVPLVTLVPLFAGCTLRALPPQVTLQVAVSPERVGALAFLALPSRMTGPGDVTGFDCLYPTLTESSDTSDKVCEADAAAAGPMRTPGIFQAEGVPLSTTAGDKTIKLFGVLINPPLGTCPAGFTLQKAWTLYHDSVGIFPVAAQSPVKLVSGSQTVTLPNAYPANSTNDLAIPCRGGGGTTPIALLYYFYGNSHGMGASSPVQYVDNPVSAWPPPNADLSQMSGSASPNIPPPPLNDSQVAPLSGGAQPHEYHARWDFLFDGIPVPGAATLHVSLRAQAGTSHSSNGATCDGSPSVVPAGFELAVWGTDNQWHKATNPPAPDGTITIDLPAGLAVVTETTPGGPHPFVHVTLRAQSVASVVNSSCSTLEIDAASAGFY